MTHWNRKTRRISRDLSLRYGNLQPLATSITEESRTAEDMVTYAFKQRNTSLMKFLTDNFLLDKKLKQDQVSNAEKT